MKEGKKVCCEKVGGGGGRGEVVEGGKRAQTEKENPKQRQMGLLGSDFAAKEGRRQVPQQSNL